MKFLKHLALAALLTLTVAKCSLVQADEIYDWSSTAANNNSAPPDGFPENMNYSEVNDAARELMAVVKRQIEATDGTNTTAGTEPAYTLSSGQSLGAAAGHVHVWTAHATSTGSVTLNVDGAGAKNVVDAAGVQLGANAIVQSGIYMTVEEGTNHRIIGTLSSPGVGSTAGTTTDNVLARFDGTSGTVIQDTGIAVDDSNNVSGMGTLSSGAITTSTVTTSGNIELGHASANTLSGSSGDVSIEGNVIYRAGGTDVPITDGGTGESSASAAFTALKQAATESATGVVELATTGEAETGTDTARAVTPAGVLASINANPPATSVALLTSGTVSAAATLDIVLTGFTAYRGLKIELYNFLPATDNVTLQMRVSTNGGSSYDAGASDYKYSVSATYSSDVSASVFAEPLNNGTTLFKLAEQIGNGSDEGIDTTVTIMGQTTTAKKPRFSWMGTFYQYDDASASFSGGGIRDTAQDTDAVRFLFSSGNIASGAYAVYGLP